MSQPVEIFIDSDRQLAHACASMAEHSIIGFDTEFVGEDKYVPDLCLVQVATPKELYVIDPIACRTMKPFWDVLIDPHRKVIVHAGREEIRMCHQATGKVPGQLIDVQVAAGLIGMGYPLSYSSLVQSVTRKTVKKGQTLTDWRRRPLTDEQISYAYDDVRYLIAMWQKIEAKLAQLKRLDWATSEFEIAIGKALTDNRVGERWRRLKGVGNLNARSLAIVQEVYRWREQLAETKNRPARYILRDDLIVELAKRKPRSTKDIISFRGLNPKDAPGIMTAIQTAYDLPDHECPFEAEREVDDLATGLVTSFLGIVLNHWCSHQELTTPLVATTNDLRQLVRARALGETVPQGNAFAKGWRAQFILPVLIDFLDGKRSMRVKSLEGEHPFEFQSVE